MPNDTPNSITGHTDLLLAGESSRLKSKMCDIIEKWLNSKREQVDFE